MGLYAGMVIAAAVLAAVWFWFRRRRGGSVPAMPELSKPPEVVAVSTGEGSAVVELTPLPGVLTRLTRIHEGPPPHQLEFEIVDRVVLGSDPAASHLVFENDSDIASAHCVIYFEGGRLYLQDLASPQGTFLNGVALTSRQCIAEQDVLKIGRTEMRITFPV